MLSRHSESLKCWTQKSITKKNECNDCKLLTFYGYLFLQQSVNTKLAQGQRKEQMCIIDNNANISEDKRKNN